MSKVNIFSLGGLQEDGKNLYVVEINEKLFVLDAGLKYPSVDLYGIDTIIPDIQYLKNNKVRLSPMRQPFLLFNYCYMGSVV